MTSTTFVKFLVLGALSIAACGKSESESSSSGVPSAKPAEPAAAPAPTLKSAYKADELWATANGMTRIERMEKFVDGVTVTGTVKGIKDDPLGEYGAELDAGGSHIVELRFADFGKAAKAKPLKAGDQVAAAKCQITNPEGDRMALVQCELK